MTLMGESLIIHHYVILPPPYQSPARIQIFKSDPIHIRKFLILSYPYPEFYLFIKLYPRNSNFIRLLSIFSQNYKFIHLYPRICNFIRNLSIFSQKYNFIHPLSNKSTDNKKHKLPYLPIQKPKLFHYQLTPTT